MRKIVVYETKNGICKFEIGDTFGQCKFKVSWDGESRIHANSSDHSLKLSRRELNELDCLIETGGCAHDWLEKKPDIERRVPIWRCM